MKLPNDETVHYKSDDGVTCIVERTELVRCKDCKYNPRNPRSWDDDDIVEHYLWCEFMAIESKYNYCSKGARNEQLESD